MPHLKTFLNFLLLIVCFLIIACQPKTNSTELHLTGTITNPLTASFLLTDKESKFEIALDANGAFDTIITLLKEGQYQLRHTRESTPLYLQAGNLHITLDTKSFDESVKYAGTSQDISNFYAAKFLQRERSNTPPNMLYNLGEDEFLKSLKEQESVNQDFLDNYSKLPRDIIQQEKDNISYESLLRIADYQMAHRYFSKNEDFVTSDKISSKLENVNLNDEALFKTNEVYARLVSSIVVNEELDMAFTKLSGIESQLIKEAILQNLKYELRPGIEKLDFVYKSLDQNTEDAKLKKELKESYLRCKAVERGKKSPNFNYVDRNGKYVSLENLRGKNVYVDVWATWCGPCLAEVPSLKLMEEKYRSKNIEFVSLSIDRQKDKDKWLSMIEEKSLKGIQLMSDKDWSSDFVVNYNIKGIPRFILIDDEGNIVSPDAPRPSSSEQLEAMFSELKNL